MLPRQNGKNAILEAFELACLVLFGDDLIVHTAHRADTTLEHFRRMKLYGEEFDEFAKLIKHVSNKNGDESIELKGNRRVKFVSRARNPGRGFSGSKVIFDEAAYGLPPAVIGAVVPTMATRPMAQVWYTSSSPKADSDVLHSVMSRGRGQSDDLDERLCYAEWSNTADVSLDDVDAWYESNPGMGIRITEEYVRAERRLMLNVPEEFARERLGIPEEPSSAGSAIIPLEQWEALTDPGVIVTPPVIALDVSPDRKWATFAVAGRRDDGLLQVEIPDRRPGTDHVVERAKEFHRDHNVPIRIEKGGPAGSFYTLLLEAGVPVEEVSTADHARACGQFIDAALSGNLRHTGGIYLRAAIVGATLRNSGDANLWSRRSSKVDITPLVAATLAIGGVPEPVGVTPRLHSLADFLDD